MTQNVPSKLWDKAGFCENLSTFVSSMQTNTQLISFCLKPKKKAEQMNQNKQQPGKYLQSRNSLKSGALRLDPKGFKTEFAANQVDNNKKFGSLKHGQNWNREPWRNSEETYIKMRRNSKPINMRGEDNSFHSGLDLRKTSFIGDESKYSNGGRYNIGGDSAKRELNGTKVELKNTSQIYSKWNRGRYNGYNQGRSSRQRFFGSPDPGKTYLKPTFNTSNPSYGGTGINNYGNSYQSALDNGGGKIYKSGFTYGKVGIPKKWV